MTQRVPSDVPSRGPCLDQQNASLEEDASIGLDRLRRGSLTLIHGCMFSGKTTRLIGMLEGRGASGVLAVKHTIDTRHPRAQIITHDGRSHPARVAQDVAEVSGWLDESISFVAVDEGHFFGMDLVVEAGRWLARGVHVAVTMLDTDSWGKAFPCFVELKKSADCCEPATARCTRCGVAANRTQRLTPIVDGDMVGGSESYEPRCVACWQPPPLR